MLMSERTKHAIDLCVQRMFYMNRVMDNLVSNMAINWSMYKATNLIHHNLAHLYPLIADKFSDIQQKFNERTFYLDTPGDTTEYSSLEEGFQRALDELMITNDTIIDAIEIAKEEGDINVKVLLEDELEDMTQVIEQHILLRDKAKQYGDNYKSFDKHIDAFFFLGNDS